MQAPVIAVVGATGLVGEILLRVLEERDFPVADLRPMASARSAGSSVEFRGKEWQVLEAAKTAFEGVDLVFFAATGALSRELAPAAVAAGATVIDKSSTWRMTDGVPLVVPEINAASIPSTPAILACPNCSTIGVVQALAPIHRAAGLRRVVITTMQAASGAGRDGVEELRDQVAALAAGQDAPPAKVFGAQLAGNVVPHCDAFESDGYTLEESKLLHETRKILDLPQLPVTATCVRVPVEVGHSASILVETERALGVEEARTALAAQPGVRVVDNPVAARYPTPLEVTATDDILVGRIRVDRDDPHRLWLWQVVDNLRKGAATNAVQTAEAWLQVRSCPRPSA
jgi:aspartate-semialdehyde dehydrogenase